MSVKENLAMYKKDIIEALEPVGKKHGLTFVCEGKEYNDYEFVISVHAFIKNDGMDGREEKFKDVAPMYSFRPEDYGREVKIGDTTFRFVGFNNRARKNVCLMESLDLSKPGQYACSIPTMHMALDRADYNGRQEREPAAKSKKNKGEQEVMFYVAECMEFTNLGEYHENLTAAEAVRFYNQIPEDRMNGIKGIGVHLHTEGDPSYKDRDIELMHLGTIDLDTSFLDKADKALAEQALIELKMYL